MILVVPSSLLCSQLSVFNYTLSLSEVLFFIYFRNMSGRITRARVRQEQIEIAELSPGDSPYTPSDSSGSPDVSLTESDRDDVIPVVESEEGG